eukprot:CCRYP_006798-RA/>CCRYP_006798-RA protein AED:0.04 eAED:0.04 QI:304/1/1/1/0/0/2/312/362
MRIIHPPTEVPHRINSTSSMTALSLCLLAGLILCLYAILGLDFEAITTSSINFNVFEGSVSTGEQIALLKGNVGRKLYLTDDPKTVEQKPVSALIDHPNNLCTSPCKGINPWLCDLPTSCIQPDPPGAPRLHAHRGLALLLHWNDCSTTQQCLLAYLMIPKAGSTLVKNTMAGTGEVEAIWLSAADGTELTNNNPLIMTLIRDPGERIVSAYSTIMSRTNGVYGEVNGAPVRFPEAPHNVTDMAAWIKQFENSIRVAMISVKENGWYNANTNPVWNEHILPQVEFMRGLYVSFIGCVGRINEALEKFQLDTSLQHVENNAYEHTDHMPMHRFALYDLLDVETKALVQNVYAEDYELFGSRCA